MTVTLYKRQRQIVEFISQFIQKNGYSPTLSEIAVAIGVSSLATIHEHLQALEKKGVIRKFDGAIRGIEIVDRPSVEGASIELPILGFIAAGRPIEPLTDPNASMKVASSMISGKKRAFVLQVKGDSMIEEGIFNGDVVILRKSDNPRNGDTVAALINGEATLKTLVKLKNSVELHPANPKYPVIPIRGEDRFEVQGVVVGLMRRYG